MAKQLVNIGVSPNTGGDPARIAFEKVNSNNSELYTALGADAVTGILPLALPITKGGTGATTKEDARTNLGLGTAALLNVEDLPSNTEYVLPKASDSILGGVKVGSGLSIDIDGVLTTEAQGGSVTSVNGETGDVVVNAENLITLNGNTQQDVNDRGGAIWYAKSGGYKLNARVILDNGDIVRSTEPNNMNNPNIDMSGWVYNASGQKSSYAKSTLQFSSIIKLREFEPSVHGDKVYLTGLNEDSELGCGDWYYDALDTTGVDHGWFIVVTSNGKRLKRVGLQSVINLGWAGIHDQGDLAVKWQEAINFSDSIRITKTHIFNCPKIVIPGQRYTMSTGVVQPTYISTKFDGSTIVKVAYSRAQCPYVVALRNASNTQDIYRNLEDGVQWNHALTCTSGKVKFVFVNTDVALVDGATRPSCIVSGNPPGTTYAYQCNMRVTNVEAYQFRSGHEVLGLNSWGYRFENCGFGGRIKEGKYSVWTSSPTNTDSGERCSYVNTFLSGIRLSTPAMYIYIDNTSSDFSLNCPVQIDATATYIDLRFINCHTEHFDEFVVNSDLTIGGATNSFVTFSGGRILPTSYVRKNTHDIVLFNGNINVLLSDGLFLENSAYPSSNNLGTNLGQNGAVVETSKVRTKEARPRINGLASRISLGNDFALDVVDAVVNSTTPTTNFSIVNMGNGATASIKLSPEVATKTLAIAASGTNGYCEMRANKFVNVIARRKYTCRPIVELLDSASLGLPRHVIYWYDADKNLISTSKPPYDITLASYITGAEVPFEDRQTKRIPIVHTDYIAPAGAVYAKQGFELVSMINGKTYYLHSVELHDAIVN